MRFRTKLTAQDKNLETGPGKYNISDVNQKHKFILSKFKNYGQAVINPLPQIK